VEGHCDRRQHRGDRLAPGQRPADLEQRPCLPFARPGHLGSRPLEGDQLADDEADEQEQEEVHPLGGILDRERVQRQDEQEVVEQKRGDGGNDRPEGAADDRRCDHRRQIGRRGVQHADVSLEQRDGE
jgi:hypothetical protein